MDVRLFEKIVRELEEAGVHYLRIAGGEPFMHPQVNEIMEICRKTKMIKSVSTNATFINAQTVNIIKNNSIDWVVVSLDGATEEINNITRGGYSEVIDGIKILIENGITTKIACVVSSINCHHIEEIVEMAEQMGVYSVGFILQSDVGRAHDNIGSINLSRDDLENFIKNVTILKSKKYNVKIGVVFPYESKMPWELSELLSEEQVDTYWPEYSFKSKENSVSCMAGIMTCAISSTGMLFGCEQMLGFPELSSGSLKEESFKNLWEKMENINILRNLNINMLPKKCQVCKNYCGGGCRAIAYENTGDLLGNDTRCDLLYE
ncbi:hypothetical protein ASU35_00735 [Acetivibrio ethanolgignens]|uniref:Radical SAM core domain-containing protein n=2 Tax=Acetivibrio ethanolgignens TaxID=290052 RepID=A0A0V8QJM0_9FIRM|nr:hypothetical protein ASU35_00735 [Acetivibrio ethanolgignens]